MIYDLPICEATARVIISDILIVDRFHVGPIELLYESLLHFQLMNTAA